VNSDGCAFGEVPEGEQEIDADHDQLPDYWESIHSKMNCLLLPDNDDSDGDGLSDGEEDYDNDGLNNLQEYARGTDPCQFNLVSKDKEEDKSLPPSDLPPPPPPDEGIDLLAWILLIIGLLMVIGGTGYLVRYGIRRCTQAGFPGKLRCFACRRSRLGNKRDQAYGQLQL